MDIKNISSHLSQQLHEAKSADSSEKTPNVSPQKADTVISDKVSLKEFSKLKNEKLFAKIELAKLDEAAKDKLKLLKTRINEFENAKEESLETARNTDIGKLLNDPTVWKEIAKKMVE